MKWLDRALCHEIDVELNKIAPEVVQNEYNTKIINQRELKIFRHIAQQRLLHRMNAFLHFSTLVMAALALWKSL